MVKDYIEKSRELFTLDESKLDCIDPLEEALIDFDTSFIHVGYYQRPHPKEGTYCIEASIYYSDVKLEFDPVHEALNDYFRDNQELINKCLTKLFNKEGLFAEAKTDHIVLANGRLITTMGLNLSYDTNDYDFSDEPEFKELMLEEANIITTAFPIVYGFTFYIKDKWPKVETLKDIAKNQMQVAPVMSKLVEKFINKEVSARMKKLTGVLYGDMEDVLDARKEAEKYHSMTERKGPLN